MIKHLFFSLYCGILGACFSLLLISCADNPWENRLSRKDLQACLEELYVMEEAIKTTSFVSNDTLHIALQNALFKKYGLTREEFDSIVFYYNKNNPLLYADIARKAAEHIRQREQSQEEHNLFVARNRSEPTLHRIQLSNVSSIIPPNTYPRMVAWQNQGVVFLHTAHIETSIPKDTKILLSTEILGLPKSLKKESDKGLLLSLSYYATDSLQKKTSCLLTENKSYELSLEFNQLFPAGILCVALHRPANMPDLYSFSVQKVEISTLSLPSALSSDSISLYNLSSSEL